MLKLFKMKLLIIFVLVSWISLGLSIPIEEASPISPAVKLKCNNNHDEVNDVESDEDFEEENFILNDNKLIIEGDDGKYHVINLNDQLEPDELYDYENLTWVNEIEHNETFGLSESSIEDHVTSSLYIKDEPDVPFELNPMNGRDAPFDINHPTKVVVHGWLETDSKMWVKRLKDKYFINGYHNVVLVDWQRYALMEYSFAARKTRKIGAYLGQVLIGLLLADKIHIEDIHIVGHSLGAHIAGIAGKTIQKQLGKKVGWITGLDPAGPLYESPLLVRKKKRLVKDDAEFVDVIHTSGGTLGFKRVVGHADFYPNKGKAIQPGCGLIKNIICSHARGYVFYTESVNSEKFLATPCESWKSFKKGKCDDAERLTMGHFLDTFKASGKYYLRTNKRSPYGKG